MERERMRELLATRAMGWKQLSRADRDIDGALDKRFGDTSPEVGDWEPSDRSIGCGAIMGGLVLAAVLWGWILGILERIL